MMPVLLMLRQVILRELMPQDLKFDLDTLTQKEAGCSRPLSRGRRRQSTWPPDVIRKPETNGS